MSCPAITLEGISPEKYSTLIATALAQGLAIAGPTGSTSYQGMSFTWAYEEAAETLTLQCTEKPFFVPCSIIESKIRALVV